MKAKKWLQTRCPVDEHWDHSTEYGTATIYRFIQTFLPISYA